MKTITISENQLMAIVEDAVKTFHHDIISTGEYPYRGYERDFAKHYSNRILAILGAVDEDKSGLGSSSVKDIRNNSRVVI